MTKCLLGGQFSIRCPAQPVTNASPIRCHSLFNKGGLKRQFWANPQQSKAKPPLDWQLVSTEDCINTETPGSRLEIVMPHVNPRPIASWPMCLRLILSQSGVFCPNPKLVKTPSYQGPTSCFQLIPCADPTWCRSLANSVPMWLLKQSRTCATPKSIDANPVPNHKCPANH